MARHVSLFGLFRSSLAKRIILVRCYAKGPITREAIDYSKALSSHKKQMTEIRKKFREDWDKKQQQKQVDNTVSYEEIEVEEIEREKNAKENEMVALKRISITDERLIKNNERRLRGYVIRNQIEKEREEIRQQKVQEKKLIEDDFITMDNLDKKTDIIFETVHNVDFALTFDGKIIA